MSKTLGTVRRAGEDGKENSTESGGAAANDPVNSVHRRDRVSNREHHFGWLIRDYLMERWYMFNKSLLIATITFLAVVGCETGQEQAPERETTAQRNVAEKTQVVEETTVIEGATTERTAPEAVTAGGFSVERPDGGETTIPQVTASREDVQRYGEQIQPIIEDTVYEVSDLLQADVRLENGDLSFDVDTTSLEEARASVRDGLEQLRGMSPPEDLEPIHQRLIEAYEQALPAYGEIIQAADSGDPQRISEAVGENLPRIESFNEETRAILQDLEQAAEVQQ